MISRNLFTDIISIIILVALQIFVLNRIILFGKYTPVLYPVFVLFYPFFRNQYYFLLLSFLLGLFIDAFLVTWGINAFATTLIAYFRTLIFKVSTERDTEFFSFQRLSWSQFLFYIFSSVFIHQFVVQFLEFFKFNRIMEIVGNVFITSLISFVMIVIYSLAFKIKQRI